jgi:tetratricopeptide (TPR) repeat protein
VVYVYAAVRIARECFPAGPARAGLGVVLVCCGTGALFFGSIEVYAPLAAAIGVYLLLGIRSRKRGTTVLWPGLALGLAFGLHGSAGLLLPSLACLANGCRWWPLRLKRALQAGLAFLVPVIVIYGAVYLISFGGDAPQDPSERYGSFLGGNGQGPLLPLRLTPQNVLHRYALLDAEHLAGVVNLVLLAAPAGVLLLLLGRRRREDAEAFRFTAVAALFLVAFPVFWNVNYGLRQDWDLFSPMGIPLTLLGALAFFGRGMGVRRAVGAAALALFCFVPLVLANRGDTYDRRVCLNGLYWTMRRAEENLPEDLALRREIARRAKEEYRGRKEANDPHGAEASTHEAEVLAESGSPRTAELLFRRVIESEPRNARAREGLGTLLVALGRHDEARLHLRKALGEQNWRMTAWMGLVRIALAEGNEEEAIRQLENALRRAGLSDQAGQALFTLAELRARRGHAAVAAALFDLAAKQGYSPGR